ncbi:hypothetical protein M758_2G002200 [Ceratodon purpureus]|nr:hypothetical protein M758_2G002200 [Ceratodon purpureus]
MALPPNLQPPLVEYSPADEDRARSWEERKVDGSRVQEVTNYRHQFKSVGEKVRNGNDSMERPSSSFRRDGQSSVQGATASTSRERLNPEGSRHGYFQSSNQSVEPEPSSVAARLKKEALANPQEEQSVEDLLSSMGVSLFADQRTLDISMAVEYGGPTFRDGVLKDKPPNSSYPEINESQVLDSIPVAVPLSLPGIRPPFMSNKFRSGMQLVTQRQMSLVPPTVTSQDCRKDLATPALDSEADLSKPEAQDSSQSVVKVSDEQASGSSQGKPQPSSKVELSSLESFQDTSNGSSVVLNTAEVEEITAKIDVPEGKQVFYIPEQIAGDIHPEELGSGLQTANPGDDEIGLPPILSSPAPVSAAGSGALRVECTSPVLQRPPLLHGRESSTSSSPSASVVLSVSEPVAVAPYMEEGPHLETDMSGVYVDRSLELDDSSMVSSPDSLHNDPDSYVHKGFDAVEERSELVNIANHGGNRPTIPPMLPWKKSGCAGCGKGNLLIDKEYCMTCGAKYCDNCLLPAMGSMPEGRKCVACLGRPIMGSRRPYIGKPSRLLKHLLSPLEVQQIMKAEKECPANQLRPEQVVVNNRPLSHEELAILLNCQRPPGRLKPGRYWYDGQTGLWGKEGHRPDRIVSPSLRVGGNLQPNASNGKTQVFMNGRELGKLELKMLKFAGVNCVPDTHLWVENDGSYSEEGFKNVKGNIWGKEGNLWEKASIKLLYPFFSLPTPRSSVGLADGSGRHSDRFPGLVDPLKIHKLLLLGHEGSGRSTIFKQAKILYNQGFTKEELVSFKCLIQANIYKYMAILLEGRERFEEEYDELADAPANKELSTSSVASLENNSNSSSPQPDVAGFLKRNDDKQRQSTTPLSENIYRLESSMKQLSDWFMESMVHGNLESTISPSSAFKIEQLWLSSAVQATFQRRSELPFLPDLASVFLNRVVDVCRSDYEPAELDILQTEGLSQGSGLVQIEICLDDKDVGSWQDADTCTGLDRYQVIRVGGKGMSDRHKWLDMFEDVRAVVFCVALSDYNSLWNDRSGNPSNKMIQTRDLFESILRHPCFQDTPFVLLLNKYDVFEDKIEKGVPLTTCTWFSDFRPVGTSHYTAQNQAQQAYQYIAHKYKELFNSVNCTGRKLFTFQLNALDKTTVSGAFQYVKEILKWEEHKAQGWGMIPEESSYSTDISSFSQRSMPRLPDLFRRQQY